MSGEARDLFAAFGIEAGDVGRYARELPGRLRADFVQAMQLLRNTQFQDLLNDYPRRRDPFVVALETQDEVTSQWLVRDGRDNEYKPADYLQPFARFVEENADEIDAIEILLNRPADWRTGALAELKGKLATAPERFTFDNLQKAHALCYQKQLVEIISMVKHAADEAQPLLTAEERVDRALAQVTAGKTFTDDQRQWLDRIRAHLVENLTIEQDDFEYVPVFSNRGGWGVANKAFQGRLAEFLTELNQAIAA
jgi:type I restriction enzyme R subunit